MNWFNSCYAKDTKIIGHNLWVYFPVYGSHDIWTLQNQCDQAHTLHDSFLSFFQKKLKNNEIIQTNFGRTVERELRSANCGT